MRIIVFNFFGGIGCKSRYGDPVRKVEGVGKDSGGEGTQSTEGAIGMQAKDFIDFVCFW